MVISIIQFAASFHGQVVFPMIPFLVARYLGSDATEQRIGIYVGPLGAALYFTSFLCSFPWGFLSDRIGRRPVLLMGLFLSNIMITGFGFSTNYWMALTFRLLNGTVDAVIGVMKSYLGEITTKETQSFAFSLINFSYGMAVCFAPLIGGSLQGYWKAYPAAAPALIGTSVSFLGFLLALFFLPETPKFLARREQLKKLSRDSNAKIQEKSIKEILVDKNVSMAVFLYGFLALTFIVFDEMLPVLVRAEPKFGGLGLQPRDLGIILTIQGVSTVMFQIGILPWITKRVSIVSLFKICGIPSAFTLGALPFVPLLRSIPGESVLGWALLALIVMFRAALASTLFTCVMIMINNSTSPSNLGKANGIGQTLAALARAVGPVLGGMLWFLGQKVGQPYLPWMINFLLSIAMWLLSLFVNPSLSIPHEESFPLLEEHSVQKPTAAKEIEMFEQDVTGRRENEPLHLDTIRKESPSAELDAEMQLYKRMKS